jgi:hypothetical protein
MLGGSVASGVYGNLKIAGACTVDAGSVTVEHDLTVLPGGSLVASAGGSLTSPVGSDVKVGGNIEVQSNGILVLGCEPIYFICSNDPDQSVGSYATKDTVGGSLRADNALSLLVHHSVIGQDVSLHGGGGGTSSCGSSLPALGGSPPMATSRTSSSKATSRSQTCNPAGWASFVTRSRTTFSSTTT